MSKTGKAGLEGWSRAFSIVQRPGTAGVLVFAGRHIALFFCLSHICVCFHRLCLLLWLFLVIPVRPEHSSNCSSFLTDVTFLCGSCKGPAGVRRDRGTSRPPRRRRPWAPGPGVLQQRVRELAGPPEESSSTPAARRPSSQTAATKAASDKPPWTLGSNSGLGVTPWPVNRGLGPRLEACLI